MAQEFRQRASNPCLAACLERKVHCESPKLQSLARFCQIAILKLAVSSKGMTRRPGTHVSEIPDLSDVVSGPQGGPERASGGPGEVGQGGRPSLSEAGRFYIGS